MSLIPMEMACTLAVSCFTTKINVVDTQYVKQGAKDVQQVFARREVDGAIDKSDAKKLENIFGGSVADGSILLFTEDKLFIGDMYDVGQPQKQSFFIWEGLNYRIAGLAPWHRVTGIRIYLGVRHVTQELI